MITSIAGAYSIQRLRISFIVISHVSDSIPISYAKIKKSFADSMRLISLLSVGYVHTSLPQFTIQQ
jgi:hypothetical protein